MEDARKAGLVAMLLFGSMGAAAYVWAVYFPNEGSGFVLTFVMAILGFAFLLGLIQAITGERPQ